MSDNSVIISVSEEELIVSLYHEYLIDHNLVNEDYCTTRLSVKAFSDYIQQYLTDLYDLDADHDFLDELDEEETDV